MTSELRDSGQSWLGSIPAHWELRPLGSVLRERKTTVSDTEYPPLSVTMNGVVPQIENVALTDNNDSRKLVKVGDYVINSRSDRKGSGGLSSLDGSVSVISTVLRPTGIEPRYAHHLLRSTAFQEEFYRWGSGIVADLWSTRYPAMRRIVLPLPPRREQVAIADFLDRETAKIDALIDKQQSMASRLLERRAGTIGRALHSDLPQERLISVIELSQTGPFGTQLAASEYVERGVPIVNPTHIQRGLIERDESVAVSDEKANELERHRFRLHDIVLGRKGDVEKSAIIGPGEVGWVCGSDSLLLRPRLERVVPKYLWWFFQSSACHSELQRWSVGSTVSGLNQRVIRQIRVPVPALSEQRAAVEWLDSRVESIDVLVAKAGALVAVAQERRAALITAAVTGQLDVATGKVA